MLTLALPRNDPAWLQAQVTVKSSSTVQGAGPAHCVQCVIRHNLGVRDSAISLSAIVTLSFAGRTLGELGAWCDALVPYGIDGNVELLDGGHNALVDDRGVGPISLHPVRATISDVRNFVARSRSAGAAECAEIGPNPTDIAVDLPEPTLEVFQCGSHLGADPLGVLASAHPLCREHV